MIKLDWRANSIKLLSLLLALILWVYVSSEQNPVREKVLSVGIEHNDLAQDYLITSGLPENVRVRVQGNRNQLDSISARDVKAAIDIPRGRTGDLDLPILVNAPAGIRVTQVIPEMARLSVDRLMEKQLAVNIALLGTPAPGYTVLTPASQPATVMARGPSREVDKMNQVNVRVDIHTVNADIESIIPLEAGQSHVTFSPAAVKVFVPVATETIIKTVPVEVKFSGIPAEGYAVKRSFIEPAAVQLSGPRQLLDGIESVKTVLVDVQGQDRNLSREADLVVPQGAAEVSPARVRVQVEIGRAEPSNRPAPPLVDGG